MHIASHWDFSLGQMPPWKVQGTPWDKEWPCWAVAILGLPVAADNRCDGISSFGVLLVFMALSLCHLPIIKGINLIGGTLKEIWPKKVQGQVSCRRIGMKSSHHLVIAHKLMNHMLSLQAPPKNIGHSLFLNPGGIK